MKNFTLSLLCACSFSSALHAQVLSNRLVLDTEKSNVPRVMATDPQGNLIVSGQMQNQLDMNFPGKNGDHNFVPQNDKNSTFIAKYDKEMNLLWVKGLTGTGDPDDLVEPKELRVDTEGNIYIAAAYKGTLSSSSCVGGTSAEQDATHGSAIFFKLNPQGEAIWSRSMGMLALSRNLGISPSVEGSLVVGGSYRDMGDLLPNAGTNHDGFIAKIGTGDQIIWSKHIKGVRGAAAGLVSMHKVLSDNEGNVFAFFSSNAKESLTIPGAPALANPGGYYASYLVKYNKDGEFVWVKQMISDRDFNPNPYPADMDIDSAGNIAIAGWTLGSKIAMDGTDYSTGIDKSTKTSAAVWFLLDKEGNYKKHLGFGNPSAATVNMHTKALSVRFDNEGNSFVGGMTDCEPVFPLNYAVTPRGDADAFLLKLDAAGNPVFIRRVGGAKADEIKSMAVDKINNRLYVGMTTMSSPAYFGMNYASAMTDQSFPCDMANTLSDNSAVLVYDLIDFGAENHFTIECNKTFMKEIVLNNLEGTKLECKLEGTLPAGVTFTRNSAGNGFIFAGTPTAEGDFSVTVSAEDFADESAPSGYHNNKNFTFTVTAPTGIDRVDANTTQVYKTSGGIFINGFEGEAEIQIFDLSGKMLQQTKAMSGNTIHLQTKQGLVIVKVINNKGVKAFKVM